MIRAERRRRAERQKRRARQFHGGWAANDLRVTGIYARTPKSCSCWCCGNPRKHFDLPSIQELRLEAGAKVAMAWWADAA